VNCGICGALSSGGQYCVGCGEPLATTLTASTVAPTAVSTRQRARPAPGAWLALQEIRLVACPKCGAPNSAARWRCARCGETFDERDRDARAARDATAEEAVAVQPESARWLVLITVAAAVAVLAVAVTMLAARGIGPFQARQEPATLAEATPISINRVQASDQGPEGGSVQNLVDGDATTVWQVTGTGIGEWVDIRFDRPVQLDHLLISNGDQRNEGSFAAAGRVNELLIVFRNADKAYKVELPDRPDSVRVTTQGRPPVSDEIRLKIVSIHEGRIGVTALSEIQALTSHAPATD
jgi:DNA-directed RNA polymerase subunit RPC12/RpoP